MRDRSQQLHWLLAGRDPLGLRLHNHPRSWIKPIWGWKILRLWLGKFCDLGGFVIWGNSEIDEEGVIWVIVRLMVVMEEFR